MSLLAFVFVAGTTAYLNQRYSPWQQLSPAKKLARNNPGHHQSPTPPPPTNSAPESTWAEVRITKPGADVVAAPGDSIPLQVEAAASQALLSLSWSISIDASIPTACPLPLTNRQLFAVVQTNIPVAALNVSEGDVLSYFATAKTHEASYTSELYFVEIRGPQEPPNNQRGDGIGQQQQQLSGDLSSLIRQQQQVIRETHRLARSQREQNAGGKRRKALSDTESDLATATRHLGAGLEADSESPGVVDSLAKAAEALVDSAAALGDNALPTALDREQLALLELIRAKKVSGTSPTGAGESLASSSGGTERRPQQTPADKLDQITEFRNESAAARAFLDQTIAQQKALAEDSAKLSPTESQEMLADRQKQLQDSLNDFAHNHPRPLHRSRQETRRALEAMGAAADALRSKSAAGKRDASSEPADPKTKQQTPGVAVAKALHELESLNSSLRGQDAQRELTNAYKLREILDDLARRFDQFAAQNTNSNPNSEVPSAARQARQTVDQLKSLADRETETFRRPLRDALSDTQLSPLRETLSELEQGRDAREQQELAGEARDGLGAISKAFDRSRPSALQRGAESSPENSSGNSLDNALAQLKQLLNQPSAGSERPAGGGSKQEALQELQKSVQQAFGNAPGGQQVLASIQELLQAPLNDADLIRLLQQVERMRTAHEVAEGPALPEGFTLDPSRLPPAYRDRIQSYFRGLSEK